MKHRNVEIVTQACMLANHHSASLRLRTEQPTPKFLKELEYPNRLFFVKEKVSNQVKWNFTALSRDRLVILVLSFDCLAHPSLEI